MWGEVACGPEVPHYWSKRTGGFFPPFFVMGERAKGYFMCAWICSVGFVLLLPLWIADLNIIPQMASETPSVSKEVFNLEGEAAIEKHQPQGHLGHMVVSLYPSHWVQIWFLLPAFGDFNHCKGGKFSFAFIFLTPSKGHFTITCSDVHLNCYKCTSKNVTRKCNEHVLADTCIIQVH